MMFLNKQSLILPILPIFVKSQHIKYCSQFPISMLIKNVKNCLLLSVYIRSKYNNLANRILIFSSIIRSFVVSTIFKFIGTSTKSAFPHLQILFQIESFKPPLKGDQSWSFFPKVMDNCFPGDYVRLSTISFPNSIFCYRVQQLNQMIERKSINNLINMEASMGFHNSLFDSNSRFMGKIKEQSLSEGFKYYINQCEEPYQPTHPFSIDNTINFADIDKHFFGQNNQAPLQFRNINQSRDTNDGSDWAPSDNLSKRGLKHLASLLLKTLINKNLSSHNEVAKQIERQLLSRSMHDYQSQKEQKNIKRRIYDALNVMISAGVLQREIPQSMSHSQNQMMAKTYVIVNKCEEHAQQIARLKSRIEVKKELLAKMQSKKNALRLWIDRKRKNKDGNGGADKLLFPLIFLVCNKNDRLGLQFQQHALAVKSNRLQIYSQTDLLEELIENYVLQGHNKNQVKQQQEFIDEITYI